MYLFTFVWIHGFPFYSMCYDPILSLFILMLNCPRFGQWEPLQFGSYILLTCSYHSLRTSLCSGTRCSRLICTFLVLALESTISPTSPGSFQWKMLFKNQDLGARCAHCYGGVASRSSQQSQRIDVYTHTHLWLFLQFSIHIY